MNSFMQVVNRYQKEILISVVSLSAGFASGYAVRASKYAKVELDDNGNILGLEASELLPSELVDFTEADRREAQAIIEAQEYELPVMVDEGFPTYPSGTPNPADIVIATRDFPVPDNPDDPHEISYENFLANEFDFSQLTLTYYEDDQVLVDEEDRVVTRHKNLLGPVDLEGFDASEAIYVRSGGNRSDYEIVKVEDSYSSVVLGVGLEGTNTE